MKALTEALLPSDLIAIGILFGVVGTLLVAYAWDLASILIAERSSAELTYCSNCNDNLEDEFLDFRFSYPVCLTCVRENNLQPDEEY